MSERLQSAQPLLQTLQYLRSGRGGGEATPADVAILCRDGVLEAHQLVIAAISPLLRAELWRHHLADDTVTLMMPDLTKEELHHYLDCVYNGHQLDTFTDINTMLGFQFASTVTDTSHSKHDTKDDLNNTKVPDNKMKEEVESDGDVEPFPDYSIITSSEPIDDSDQSYKSGFKENGKRKYNAQPQHTRKKRSKVWEHFQIDPDNPEQCICNICHGSVSYKNGGTSSMMSHIKSDHVMLKVDPELLKEPGFVKSGIGDGTRKKRSKVWEYFSVNPDNPNQCVCVICKESVNYLNRGTSSMTSHLKCEHDIWVIKFARKEMGGEGVEKKVRKAAAKKEPVVDPETGEIKKSVECRAKRRKELWKHFESYPQDNLKARCKICQDLITITEKSSISQTLVKHLNTHDIKLELETCSVCGKTFEERAKRRKHEKNHQAKCSCSYCGKLFSDNTARILHERVHTGEKPFQCSQCGRKFGQKYHLRVHMRVHTGETPYHCQSCNQSFKHLSSRNNHKCVSVNLASTQHFPPEVEMVPGNLI